MGCRSGDVIKKAILYGLLGLGALIFLFPFWFMFIGGFRDTSQIFSGKFTLLPEDGFKMDNFIRLFEHGFGRSLLNTVLVASTQTLFGLFFCSLAGFAFAKFQFPGRDALFTILLATMMVPFQVTVIPLYIMMTQMHWINTFYALIIPGIVTPFGVFLMRQYMTSVPDELIDAATIDGCGDLQTFFHIALPIVEPGLIVLGIVYFMNSWNDFFWPLIVISNENMYTFTLKLASFQGVYYYIEYGAILGGAFIGSLPLIILFFIFKDRLVAGILSGAFR